MIAVQILVPALDARMSNSNKTNHLELLLRERDEIVYSMYLLKLCVSFLFIWATGRLCLRVVTNGRVGAFLMRSEHHPNTDYYDIRVCCPQTTASHTFVTMFARCRRRIQN